MTQPAAGVKLKLLIDVQAEKKERNDYVVFGNTVVPGFSVLGFRALPGFRALCTGNQIWIYVINLPGFSALPGFKAPFHGDEQSALQPGTTLHRESIRLVAPYLATPQF